ncbi:Ankyrin repeat and sterile alpha motif domain-containing protein 1B [Symbiodinium microadriaticum]|uniref:Ankyrin repeat and sterile alpha motif domain-containing protein 1B n=1 Tax=Symbiodinium microadriaticum TaxID=2951 RepID=A0A1Q9CKS8_SYMMI|nr:Ankyrin repeat and sterile alpha motif domain-containing protein 1B [Symbiodinium microadriaticum]
MPRALAVSLALLRTVASDVVHIELDANGKEPLLRAICGYSPANGAEKWIAKLSARNAFCFEIQHLHLKQHSYSQQAMPLEGRQDLMKLLRSGEVDEEDLLECLRDDVRGRDPLEDKGDHAAHQKDKDWWTPLHWAAQDGHERLVEKLLGLRVSTNAADICGATPLMIAAFNGRTRIIEALLRDRSTDVRQTNKYLGTALHYAAQRGHAAAVELLIDARAEDPLRLNSVFSSLARTFRREMSWWMSSLDSASTMKYNLAARWLLRQSGIVRQRGEEFSPEDLAFQPAHEFVDPETGESFEVTPADPFFGLNKLLKALESMNGQSTLDKRGELRTAVADLKAEGVVLPDPEDYHQIEAECLTVPPDLGYRAASRDSFMQLKTLSDNTKLLRTKTGIKLLPHVKQATLGVTDANSIPPGFEATAALTRPSQKVATWDLCSWSSKALFKFSVIAEAEKNKGHDVAVDGTGGGALRAERGVLGAERLREGRGRGRDGDGWGALGAERSLRDAPVDGDGWRGGRKKLRAGRSWDYVGVDGTVGSSGCRAFAGGTWPWTDGAELWVPSVRGRTWPWTERAGVGAERLREDAAVPSVHGRMRPCAELWVRREVARKQGKGRLGPGSLESASLGPQTSSAGTANAFPGVNPAAPFINALDRHSDSPLSWAARSGHLDAVKKLVENGADPLLDNNASEDPIELAKANGFEEVAEVMEASVEDKEQLAMST